MTGRDLVTAALRLIGAVAPGESLGSQEATDGLAALNRMLGSWSNENLLVYSRVREEFALTASDGIYTMGTGGNFNTTRPIEIEQATIEVTASSVSTEYAVKILTSTADWARVRNKDLVSSFPQYLFAEGTFPLETVNLYPVPAAAYNLVLYSRKALTEISALTTDITLPVGYDRALIFNLAIDLAPEYGRAAPNEVLLVATESKASIKRTNQKARLLRVDSALVARGGFNIYTGENT